MSDIVERLRAWARDLQTGRDCFGADQDLKEAADEIERLRGALKEINSVGAQYGVKRGPAYAMRNIAVNALRKGSKDVRP